MTQKQIKQTIAVLRNAAQSGPHTVELHDAITDTLLMLLSHVKEKE